MSDKNAFSSQNCEHINSAGLGDQLVPDGEADIRCQSCAEAGLLMPEDSHEISIKSPPSLAALRSAVSVVSITPMVGKAISVESVSAVPIDFFFFFAVFEAESCRDMCASRSLVGN